MPPAKVFSPQNTPTYMIGLSFCESFLRKILTSHQPICKSFLPPKFSTIIIIMVHVATL